ncbi:MAG TPA: glycogen/starch synthase, partial [Tepidisphaeraceae bacterium]|nr:glycogen/starch synthase [Tepidisphaeraceae bacterium]
MRVFMLGWEFPPFISGGLGTACYGLTKAMSSLGTDIMFVLPRPVSTPFSTHLRIVSPRADSPLAMPSTEFRLDEFEHVTFRTVDAQMSDPYTRPDDYRAQMKTIVEERTRITRAIPVDPVLTPAEQPAAAPAGTGKGGPVQTVNVKSAPSPAAAAATPSPATPGFIGASTGPGSHYAGDLFSEIQRYANLAAAIAKDEQIDIVHAHDWMTFPAGLAVSAAKGVPLVVHVHSTEFDRSGVHV